MGQEQIFISYRRDDSAGYARALHDALARRFGEERVFIDVEDIGAGQAFAAVIAGAVGRSEVLLVLIGKRWLGERDGAPPRLHEPGDFVRREIEEAIAQGAKLIPVLLDGAVMPAADRLPPSLQALVAHHGVELRGSRWQVDLAGLLDALAAIVDAPAAAPAVPARAAVHGHWHAEVVYPWPNARFDERFEFFGDGSVLRGSASYLRVARGIVDGHVEGDRVRFETRTLEVGASGERRLVHRYDGRVDGDRLHLTMQTERSGEGEVPVHFVAWRQRGDLPAPR